MSRRAWVPWLDTTLRLRAEELYALLDDPEDVALLRRWADGPERLTGLELLLVENVLLPRLRDLTGQYGEQPSYRWVDSRTGQVDE